MAPTEQLHDLASRRRRLSVVVDPSPIYDLLLVLWSTLGDDEKSQTHEVGRKWFDEFRTQIPADALEAMRPFGGDRGRMWLALAAAIAAEAPEPRDPDAILGWLSSDAFASIRESLVREVCWPAGDECIEAALEGDAEAIADCLDRVGDPGVVRREEVEILLDQDPAELGSAIADALRRVRDVAFAPHEEEWAPALAASAEEVRRLATTLEPSDLIEQVTRGISYELPLGTTRLVLVPTVSLRPWTLVTEHGSAIVIAYPVADEHLQADPDAPPAWLIRFYKALGDERRLRVLRRLAEGEATLAQLTDLLGLAKSTVFHHIGVLRSAGLIRVLLTVDKEAGGPVYALRDGAFGDARRVLDEYLSPSEELRGEGAES